MKKVLSIFGTRPEAIKMAPVIKELEKHPDKFINRVCVTAQHRQMLDQVLDLFEIRPDYDLNIMKSGQDLFDVTCNVMQGLKKVLQKEQPDVVLVHGDTTTTMAASIAAFYCRIPVAHVEAGLRTHNKFAPFPEEINRQVTTRVADLHFAPTEIARRNLLAESVPDSCIYITGNTVIDALLMVVDKVRQPEIRIRIEADLTARFSGLKDVITGISGTTGNTHSSGSQAPVWEPNPMKLQLSGQFAGTNKEAGISKKQVPKPKLGHQEKPDLGNRQRLVLVTGHRRENFGDGFESICQALKHIATNHPDVEIVYPVHLNPNVQEPVNRILAGVPSVHLIEPLDYLPFVYLLDSAHLIITDSGGVQEEAPSLGKPVLVMRETTERPEAVDAGTVKLVGTDPEKIVGEATTLLTDPTEYTKMSRAHNPYGDGKACARIVEAIHLLKKQ